jgi:hypothetical protein
VDFAEHFGSPADDARREADQRAVTEPLGGLPVCMLSFGVGNHDQFAADLAFSAVRRGRGVAADLGVRELASPPVGAFLSGCAVAGLVAFITGGTIRHADDLSTPRRTGATP